MVRHEREKLAGPSGPKARQARAKRFNSTSGPNQPQMQASGGAPRSKRERESMTNFAGAPSINYDPARAQRALRAGTPERIQRAREAAQSSTPVRTRA